MEGLKLKPITLSVLAAAYAFGRSNYSEAKDVNLPGSLAGGVEICSVDGTGCIITPEDKETPVKVLSYRDRKGEAVVLFPESSMWRLQIKLSYRIRDVS